MAFTLNKAWGFEAGLEDFYVDEGWTFSNEDITADTAYIHRDMYGNGGSYAIAGYYVVGPPFTAGPNWMHFWFKPLWQGGWGRWGGVTVNFYRNGAYQFHVALRSSVSGSIIMCRGGTVVASAPAGSYVTTVPHWVALYFVADTSTGRCILFIDGVEVLDTEAGANTSNSGNSGWDQFVFGYATGPAEDMFGVLDDILLVTETGSPPTTPLPECIIPAIRPSSDVTPNEWTPLGGGNHYDKVNEAPVSKTQYLESQLADDEELFGATDIVSAATVYGVTLWAWAARSGSITKGQNWIDSGGTTSYATAQTLPASPAYGVVSNLWTTDPNTSSAWITAGVNALKVGFKSIT